MKLKPIADFQNISKRLQIPTLDRLLRNRDRFRAAIYFHLGGLDLYPDAVMK